MLAGYTWLQKLHKTTWLNVATLMLNKVSKTVELMDYIATVHDRQASFSYMVLHEHWTVLYSVVTTHNTVLMQGWLMHR